MALKTDERFDEQIRRGDRTSKATRERALNDTTRSAPPSAQVLADRAFARASGADPIEGNTVRLLRDAAENFPAWLHEIRNAQRLILFESYIFANDEVGREFTAALAERARVGVHVYVIYDWLGSLGAGALWKPLIAAGAHVASFNPPVDCEPHAELAKTLLEVLGL